MPQISLLNMAFGFFVIFVAACLGTFLVNDITQAQVVGSHWDQSWQALLYRSAHGHTNLFGMLHILLGITFPYSALSPRMKVFQTIGLFLGTIAMSFLLFLKSFLPPRLEVDVLSCFIGVFLSLALVAIGMQFVGLLLRIRYLD